MTAPRQAVGISFDAAGNAALSVAVEDSAQNDSILDTGTTSCPANENSGGDRNVAGQFDRLPCRGGELNKPLISANMTCSNVVRPPVIVRGA